MTIFYFGLKRSLRQKPALITTIIVPLVMLAVPPLWQGEAAFGFLLYGIILLFSAFMLIRSVMSDRISGVAVRIFAAPVTTLRYLGQNLLAFSLIIGLQTAAVTSVGVLLYEWPLDIGLKLALCYIVFTTTSLAFSLAWSTFFRNREMSDGIFSIVVSLMALMGIMIPPSELPSALQKISMLFPTYWFSSAVYAVFEHNTSQYPYMLCLGIMLLFTMAFLTLGSRRKLE